jgi:tetratricopeptide (TPR) repeat protein
VSTQAPSGDTPSRARWPLWAGIILLAAGGALALWLAWPAGKRPPEIDITNASPALVQLIEDARSEVARQPRSADAWGHLGMVLLAHDYNPEAKACFEQAADLDPQATRWRYLLARSMYPMFPMRVIDILEKAVTADEADTSVRLFLGEVLVEQGRTEEAERHFTRALASREQKAWAHLRLGQLALRRNQPQKALEHAKLCEREVVAANVDPRDLHVLLAEIYQQTGELKLAEAQRQKALTAPAQRWPDPHLEAVNQLKTDVLARLAHAGQAGDREIELIEAIVRDHPKSIPARVQLAKAFEEGHHWQAAASAASEALRLDPDNAVALSTLGFAHSKQGQFARAIDAYARAIQQNPNDPVPHYWLAFCLEKQNNKPAAIKALREAVRLRPNYGNAWLVLGQLQKGENDTEALKCLRRALEIDPNDAVAARAIQDMEKK